MNSKEELNADGHRHNVATENSDTMALQKKRARRVSFAEMTSVHFFDRDEEYNETPLTENAKIRDDSDVEIEFGGQLEGNKESRGEDDGDDDDVDEDEMAMRSSFLRPVGSPSPGGSTFGSASSNDEDNFFGPVSANFIRPSRLSDSGASDDNHDVTMDSTAFSMHYRSLARSESGVDLKTPTGGQLFFEEKTPTNPNIGSSMIVTLGKKHIPKSLPGTEVSGSHSSNDMSLVGENPNKYDYEKLSPGLDALLEESQKNLLSFGVSDDIITSVSPKRREGEGLRSIDHGDNPVNSGDCLWNGTSLIISHDVLKGNESAARSEFGEANYPQRTSPSGLSPKKISPSTVGAAASNRDDYKPNGSPYELSKNESDSLLMESTSPPIKRQQILLTAASPSKHLAVVSPLPEKPGSLLRNESVERQETETSIQRSISKLELLEKSAFSSTLSARVDNSIVKSLASLKSPNFDTFLGKSSHISRISFVEDSVNEEKLAGAHQSKETSYDFSIGHTRAETLNHINGENPLEEHLGQIIGGNLPSGLSAGNLPTKQLKYSVTAASPSNITWLGNNLMPGLFTSKQSNEDALMTETEFSLAEIASGNGGNTFLTPKYVSSPGRVLQKKLSASPGLHSSQSKDLLLRSRLNQFSEDKGRDSTSERNLADVNLSTGTTKSNVTKGMKRELSSPFVDINHSGNLIELKGTDRGEFDIYNNREIFETRDKFINPSNEKKSQVMQSKILDFGNQTGKDIFRFEDNLDGEGLKAISHGSASQSACRNLDEPKFQKNLVEFPKASSPRNELENLQSPRIKSPKTTQLSDRLEHFSATKRNLELLLRDTQHKTEMARAQRSPKLQKLENRDPEMLLHPSEGRTTLTGHGRKTWTDTYSKLSEDMKILISGSADELNSKMIDALEVMLVHQKRTKIYEMLHLGAMPQNTVVIHDLQFENVAEANSLLHRLVFEKAKLQLKHVKRERLLKRLQLLSSRVQESQMLRANLLSLPPWRCSTKLLVDAVDDQSLSVNLKKGHEVCYDNLTAMRQASEALDRKILNLTRSFHTSCKMKAEPSCGETIALVNEHLIKRASCRFIRQDMQMWVIHNMTHVNGQHSLVLNYLDLIIQSIIIIVGPASSATILFKLNEANIIKHFANMEVCVAFAYVFNAETTRKYIGAKTLVQEMQVTSSLLGTLLDVVEEVQLAQLEFQNLTESTFSLRSVNQLDLTLRFFNFNSGRKVILTLDMSCLKRGIYPSEILPIEVASPGDGQKSSLSGPIFDEIRNALKGVGTGYTRILRLCRCVSQVVREHRKTT